MQFKNPTIIPVGAEGTEDVLVDERGRVYTGLADGRILRVSDGGANIETIAQLSGRPYGLEFLGDDELVVCAGDLGLLAVSISTSVVRTLADRVRTSPILTCNNAAVAFDGTIYFSDSSQRYRIPDWRRDLVEHSRSGRLLRRDPDGTVHEILGGLDFANGVALAQDESFVTVAETGACRVRRVWLGGTRAGTDDVFLEDLPWHPDNSSTGSDGLIWVALASPRVGSLDSVRKLPGGVRTIVGRLPTWLQPAPKHSVGVVGVDDQGQVVHAFEGEIEGFRLLTGVREQDGKLYFGSLNESAIAVADR